MRMKNSTNETNKLSVKVLLQIRVLLREAKTRTVKRISNFILAQRGYFPLYIILNLY